MVEALCGKMDSQDLNPKNLKVTEAVLDYSIVQTQHSHLTLKRPQTRPPNDHR